MWLKISITDSNKKKIFFPHFVDIPERKINIIFGGKNVKAIIHYYNHNISSDRSVNKNFIKVKITSELQEKLLIPESLIYQYKIIKNNLEIGPVIALLLGNYRYTPRHMKKYNERLGIYKYTGGLIYAFTPQGVDFENEHISGLFFNHNKSNWEHGQFPFPSFIYRRDFSTTPPELIKNLREITGNNLYNSYRFSKMELYELLTENEEFKQYIPPTRKLDNFQQLKNFIANHRKAILKPDRSSRGRGIFIIEKKNRNSHKLIVHNRSHNLDNEGLHRALKRNHIFAHNYLIQKYLDLAKINDSFFDVRVVMQKVKPEKWLCSGIEVRKAKKSRRLTNISRGGTALGPAEGLKRAFSTAGEGQKIKTKILKISRKFCLLMDETEENYHEFGLDIAVDQKQKLWFLEANVLPSFNGFKNINYRKYLSIRYNPLIFAVFKSNFKITYSQKLDNEQKYR